MSSPVQDDADKQLMHALPWVSDPKRQDETRRLQEDVVAAAQRLLDRGLASQTRAQPAQQRTDVGLRLAEPRSSEEKRGLEEITARVLAALKPEMMPPSLRAETRLPGSFGCGATDIPHGCACSARHQRANHGRGPRTPPSGFA